MPLINVSGQITGCISNLYIPSLLSKKDKTSKYASSWCPMHTKNKHYLWCVWPTDHQPRDVNVASTLTGGMQHLISLDNNWTRVPYSAHTHTKMQVGLQLGCVSPMVSHSVGLQARPSNQLYRRANGLYHNCHEALRTTYHCSGQKWHRKYVWLGFSGTKDSRQWAQTDLRKSNVTK